MVIVGVNKIKVKEAIALFQLLKIRSENMRLIDDEKVIAEICFEQLILTTHRIRYQTTIYGTVELTSIMLEEIASCSVVRKNQPILLMMALIVTFIGIMASINNDEAIILMLVIAMCDVVLTARYLIIRQPIILIASAGKSIKVKITDMELDAVLSFIDSVEIMKNERFFMNI